MPSIACLLYGARVHSTHTCTLDIPSLPPNARPAHIIPGLASHSLLSVVTLCNAGCTVHFTKIGCTIVYQKGAIVCGHKCTRTGLWMIPLSKDAKAPPADFHPTVAMAANIDATPSTAEYARYIHQTLCSPTAATLLLALTKSTELKTIPSLTTKLIHPHLPKSQPLCRHAPRLTTCSPFTKHVRCTTCFALPPLPIPRPAPCTRISLGRFLFIFVAYIYNLNAIIVCPMPNRTDASFIVAFTEVFHILQAR